MTIENILLSIGLGFLGAQIPKFIYNFKKSGVWQFSSFLQNGGMPSSHTSTTVALTTAMALESEWKLFVICALFTLVVMNDAMKVRRETGEEAKILNQVMEKENILHRRLTERVGHTPLQVGIGLLVGIVSALIIYSL